jgi:lipopolysaccharide export system protein LptA
VSEFDKAMRNIEDAGSGRLKQPGEDDAPARRIVVDKRTHRVRLENETESEVTVVIEEKDGRQ